MNIRVLILYTYMYIMMMLIDEKTMSTLSIQRDILKNIEIKEKRKMMPKALKIE